MNPMTSGGATSADMYLDLSLKRAGKVKGESTSAGHAGDVVVRGFSWGVGAAGDAVAGQQTGRRSYRQLTITKDLDSASTALMSAVATNDEVKSAKLYLRKAGGAQEDYFCLTLEKARIASYDIDCDADGASVVVHGDNGIALDGTLHRAGTRFRWGLNQPMTLARPSADNPPCTLTLAARGRTS